MTPHKTQTLARVSRQKRLKRRARIALLFHLLSPPPLETGSFAFT
jgi:hypothetical protein